MYLCISIIIEILYKMKRHFLSIVCFVAVLSLFGQSSCVNPNDEERLTIAFYNEVKARENIVVQSLIDIRNAEMFYKQVNGCYTDNIDVLVSFCKTTQMPVVRLMPDPNDMTFTQVIYDTLGYVSVVDTLSGNRTDFNIDDLGVIPFSEPRSQYELNAGFVNRGSVSVPVFEAKVPYEVFLSKPSASCTAKDWSNRVMDYKKKAESQNRYPGLKVGSMEEATLDGSWERL